MPEGMSKYKEISIEIREGVRVTISDPNLIKFYEANRERVERYLKEHITEALGDIQAGESLDSVIQGLNGCAILEKHALMETYKNGGNPGSS